MHIHRLCAVMFLSCNCDLLVPHCSFGGKRNNCLGNCLFRRCSFNHTSLIARTAAQIGGALCSIAGSTPESAACCSSDRILRV